MITCCEDRSITGLLLPVSVGPGGQSQPKGLAEAKGRLRASVQEADIQDTNAASGFCLL